MFAEICGTEQMSLQSNNELKFGNLFTFLLLELLFYTLENINNIIGCKEILLSHRKV